jgi:hypothetical protein
MNNAFIFHGAGGYPEENWFPWLKVELEAKGLEVIVPHFPTPEGQSLEAWLKVLEPYRSKINAETILVAHSLGCIFALRLLEILNKPIKLVVFVSPPIGIKPIGNYETDFAFSNGFNFNWEKIKAAANNFIVYHSDNDPNVSFANGQELAKHLAVELTFIPNAGHFNKVAGYTKFDDLLNKILSVL